LGEGALKKRGKLGSLGKIGGGFCGERKKGRGGSSRARFYKGGHHRKIGVKQLRLERYVGNVLTEGGRVSRAGKYGGERKSLVLKGTALSEGTEGGKTAIKKKVGHVRGACGEGPIKKQDQADWHAENLLVRAKLPTLGN